MPSKILVVDDDPWTQRLVIAALRGQLYETRTAGDGAAALERAFEETPDLIISDIIMPKMDGWSLVRNVRAIPSLSLVPFIFLTSLTHAEDVVRGFGLGADDYLPKPFWPDELAARVASVLRRSRLLAVTSREHTKHPSSLRGFSGSLQELGVSTLLGLLELERKTGLLTLQREGERCRLFLRQGRIFGALMDQGPEPHRSHAELVYYLLNWFSGSFVFRSTAVEMADSIQIPTTALLLEGARRLDTEEFL